MRRKGLVRRAILTSFSAGMLLAFGSTPHAFSAQLTEAVRFDIKPQQLDTALLQFSKQSGISVSAPTSSLAGKKSAGVTGEVVAEAALRALLEGTGLTYKRMNDHTVAVGVRGVESEAWNDSPETAEGMLLAQGGGSASSSAVAQAQAPQSNAANSANAQSEDTLQEIVVTAQKREERLQDVPVSISVLSGDSLDRSTDPSLTEALSRVPGVALSLGTETGAAKLLVRGVTASGSVIGGGSSVGYYLDSVPFGFAKHALIPEPDAYDLDRVEVLRGPQGTLYGASALNGVVRVLTKDANPDAFELKARTSISGTDMGGENYRGDLAINVPIVEGKLAARAVLGYQDLSGWIDKPNKEDANDAERGTARLKINAQPTEQLSIGLSAWLSRSDFGAPSTGTADGQNAVLGEEPVSADFDSYGLTIGYDFPGVSLTSATSYLEYEHKNRTDLVDFFAPGFFYDLDLGAKTFAQEINLISTNEGPWRWSAGGMYRDSSDTFFQDLPDLIPAPISEENVSQSYAVFGEVTRLFMDGRWELTAGLRYFEDDVKFTETSRLDAAPPEQLIKSDSKFDATTTRFALTWHPSERMTAYASFGEGFRSGAEQNSETLTVAPDFPPIEPDTLLNYEVGTKGTLWDGRFSFDAALYYIDWQDVQLFLVVPASPQLGFDVSAIVNGASASGIGTDFSLTTQATDRLSFGVNAGWNDLTIDEDVISGGNTLFREGDRIFGSLEWTAGASADYVFPMRSFEGHFSTSAIYTSEWPGYTLQPDGTREAANSDAMLIAQARFSIRSPNHWSTTLFVDNLNNEDGSQTATARLQPNRFQRTRPRTIGVQLEYRF